MTEYELECIKCGAKFTISKDARIPLFNETRKYNWEKFECPSCGTMNRYARFSKTSNLLLAIE